MEPFHFSFFSITGWGIVLDYCDITWYSLEMNRDHSVIFKIASKYCILANRWGNSGKVSDFFGGAPKSLQMVIVAMKLKDAYTLKGKLYQPRQHIKKQRYYFVNKSPSSKG